jgi:hypothetical protein
MEEEMTMKLLVEIARLVFGRTRAATPLDAGVAASLAPTDPERAAGSTYASGTSSPGPQKADESTTSIADEARLTRSTVAARSPPR